MPTTFAQLGIPFPLFEGPVEGTEYSGLGRCGLCGEDGRHCFRLGGGGAVMVSCPRCGTTSGLSVADRRAVPCRCCEERVPFPEHAGEELLACYTCLRAGRAAFTRDTELGMISWIEALEGVTGGMPGLWREDFDRVPKEDGWAGVRLPQHWMWELLRTPAYPTWQGERWLFCCRRPMVYVGEWSREEFRRRAPDGDGPALFARVVRDSVPGLWRDNRRDDIRFYVFRCPECRELSAHWDMD